MIIKYGGNAMTDAATRQRAAAALYDATRGGEPPVVVHGGGPFIQAALDAAGLEHRFERGLRVTTPESLEVIERVLTLLGKRLAQEIGPAVGLTGRDADLLHATRRAELGQVGRMQRVNPRAIAALRAADGARGGVPGAGRGRLAAERERGRVACVPARWVRGSRSSCVGMPTTRPTPQPHHLPASGPWPASPDAGSAAA